MAAGSSILRRASLALAAVVVFLLLVVPTFEPVHARNRPSVVDVLAMVILIAPFLALRWLRPPRTVSARFAWWLCALMAVDVLAWGVMILAPTHGHPSLEVMVAFWIGFAKLALVPAALACLLVAALRGERALLVLLGAVCLACQTVYTLENPDEPMGWFALLAHHHP